MSGACFICDQPADGALVVIRFDGIASIDARNGDRTQRRQVAA